MNTHLSYYPEGDLIDTQENREALSTPQSLAQAQLTGRILEARVTVCDSSHNLWVDLPCMKGMIPRAEGAVGIAEGEVRDIALIARVGKPVCFRVLRIETDAEGQPLAILSRRIVQEACQAEYLAKLQPGDIIGARVTHLEPFGAFVDIGCGVASMVPIDMISVSRISHPSDRFSVGQRIRVIVKGLQNKHICLSHKELLGTWEENAALYHAGETTTGIVRSIEKYGVFIELMPNLAGLAELRQPVAIGQRASVYIKALIPEKLKVKLILVDICEEGAKPEPIRYFYQGDHIDRWVYTPESSGKHIETVFDGVWTERS
ncbi:MAG: S1 RNA-binding domain-containing protein [Oscillospiraceae bacterium]|nr:S1 RNA-binding domain-containing protein [Oscillospiraceae bacterium]